MDNDTFDSPVIQIPLSQGYTALISQEDADLALLKWSVAIRNRLAYSQRNIWAGKTRTVAFMHRVIIARMLGRDLASIELVDHINGNGCDNRRENLRLATKSQNLSNQGKQQHNTSGFKGVTWHNQRHKWIAQIGSNGKHMYLGVYLTKEEAARAYDIAALKYHGEFAKLNFPED